MRKTLQFKDPLSGKMVDYFLEKKAIKTLRMRLTSKQEIIVAVPLKAKQATIDQFIAQNLPRFILRQFVNNLRSSINLKTQSFYLFGKQLHYTINEKEQKLLFANPYPIKLSLKNKTVEETINDYCKKELKIYLIQKQLKLEKQMQIVNHLIYIRHKERAWATNHVHQKKIYYCTKLAAYSKEIIDYVIVHELAHNQHPNHSKAFWQLVALHEPEYKIKRKKLNTYLYS